MRLKQVRSLSFIPDTGVLTGITMMEPKASASLTPNADIGPCP
jgi:hypothetical protein